MRVTLIHFSKWCIVSAFAVMAIVALLWANTLQDVRYLMPALLAAGASFVLGGYWLRITRVPLVVSMALVALTGYAAQQAVVPTYVFVFTGWEVPFGYTIRWIVLTWIAGLLVMPHFLNKHIDE